MLKRISPGTLLIALPALWLVAFFVVPLILMAIMSLRPNMLGGLFSHAWMPTLENYADFFSEPRDIRLLGISAVLALIIAGSATVLAYPLAYFLTFRAGRRAPVFLTLLILPFWTSYLLRILAWKIILGTDGFINSVLVGTGLVEAPLGLLALGLPTVVVTLVYVWLPFVCLPIYAALQRVDKSLLEAAAILGAPPWLTFLRVTLPLSLPGVFAGFFMCFIPTVGEYITPQLVGGVDGWIYGNAIEHFFGDGLNWSRGSAMAFVMLAGVLAVGLIFTRLADLRRLIR